MKAVGMVRARFHPEAACADCPWACQGSRSYPATRVRSQAEHHVKDTGHHVTVEILDRTSYYPYPAVTP